MDNVAATPQMEVTLPAMNAIAFPKHIASHLIYTLTFSRLDAERAKGNRGHVLHACDM